MIYSRFVNAVSAARQPSLIREMTQVRPGRSSVPRTSDLGPRT